MLNRFDNILECFNKVYQLHEGPQTRDFGCDVLLGRGTRVDEYGSDGWDEEKFRNVVTGALVDGRQIANLRQMAMTLVATDGMSLSDELLDSLYRLNSGRGDAPNSG